LALLNGSNNTAIYTNYIGVNINGQAIAGAQQPVGILIDGSSNNLVGTDGTIGIGNLIAGNAGPGVMVRGATSTQNKIGGNLIGLSATLTALGNTGHGVVLTDGANNNLVGGTISGAINYISANGQSGIALLNQANNNKVQLNSIGIQTAGNAGPGILLDNVTNNLIGDPAQQLVNGIRNHAQGAIQVNANATGNQLLGNSLFSNSGGGIVLAPQLAELPRTAVIRQITRNGNNATIFVEVKAPAGSTVRVDYYASQAAHASGFGEGQAALASASLQIPAAGRAQLEVTVPIPDATYTFFTATLTDATNTTYGFSRATTINHYATEVATFTTIGPTNDVQPIQLTTTLRDNQGQNPTGIVEYYDGDTKIGEATLNSSRTATLSVHLSQGSHLVYAIYKGSDTFAGLISPPLGVNVVAGPPNVIPIANTDAPSVQEDGQVNINVLANDVDPDGGTILATSVTITQQPAHGTATVNATTGVITYKPNTNYDGPDQLRYTITDNRGGVSNPGNVNITVVDTPEPYYNKLRPLDVDNDTKITATDAVLVINQLNALGAGALPPPSGTVTIFYDTDGDNILAPLDALLVINALNSGSGEAPAGEPPVDAVLADDWLGWMWQEDERRNRR
jgi:hypothetical protein